MKETSPINPFEQSSQESSERKRKTFEIKQGENAYAFEAESYDFEYPKNVQEETGIIGYERMTVSNENLFKLAKEWLIKEQGISLEELGLDSWEPLHEYLQKKDWESENWNKVRRGLDDITLFQLDSLSNDEYPTYCYNHKMGAYADTKETHAAYLSAFKKDYFFLQKIYDLDNIEKEVERTGKAYTNVPSSKDGDRHINFTLYDKKTRQPVIDAPHIPIRKLVDYKDKIASGEIYAAQTHSGLNFTPGFFFWGVGDMKDTVSFGFPFNADSFMEEYLYKATKEILSHGSFDDQLAGHLVALIMISDAFKSKDLSRYREWSNDGERNKSFKTFIAEILASKLKKMNISEERDYKELLSWIEYDTSAFVSLMDKNERHFAVENMETDLPIFIGHDEIPQLSWGHAKYANYYNEKGLNFFTFKHADHLPVRKEKSMTRTLLWPSKSNAIIPFKKRWNLALDRDAPQLAFFIG